MRKIYSALMFIILLVGFVASLDLPEPPPSPTMGSSNVDNNIAVSDNTINESFSVHTGETNFNLTFLIILGVIILLIIAIFIYRISKKK